MTRQIGFSRFFRRLMLLGVCLLMLSAVPPGSAAAAVKEQPLDNDLTEFAHGTFQRTSLGAVRIPSMPNQKIVDQTGAVQLGPIGLLRNWKVLDSHLPRQLSNMGTTSIGNRMFIIGGLLPEGGSTAEVWSAAIDTSKGTLLAPGFEAEPSLTKVHGAPDQPQTQLIAELSQMAVAGINLPSGGGYIYAIGGLIPVGTRSYSSFVVQRAQVNANGRIVGNWVPLADAQIPSPDSSNPFGQLGIAGATAAVYTAPSGRTFIYVVGGYERALTGTGGATRLVTQGTRRVWCAEVNLSNGALVQPGTTTAGWKLMSDIPLPSTLPSNAGLWNTVAVADHFLTNVGGYSDALYVIGGVNTPSSANQASTSSQAVYRALIDPNTAALTWTTSEGPDIWQGTLPQARSGLGGALFRGNIYLTSGQQGGQDNPDTSVLTTYVEDNLRLHNFGALGVGSDFLENPSALDCSSGNPCTPRTTHGTLLIPAGPSAPNAAFIYIVGGRGAVGDSDPNDDNGSDTIVMARIGGDEDINNTGYAPDGLFYSKVIPINFDQAQLQQVSWATQITRTNDLVPADIEMDYRVSNDANCSAPSWNDTSWLPLDGDPGGHRSINGQNSIDIAPVPSHCFQYRARLVSNADLKETPSLLNVSIRIIVPGAPDLWVSDLSGSYGTGNTFLGLTVSITNQSHSPNTETITLDADTESQGSFYVDLFIYGPGQTPAPPGKPPQSGDPQAYANINKSVMLKGVTLNVANWLDANDNPVNLTKLFTSAGTYTIYAVVDSTDYVAEGTTGGENNNVSEAVTVTIEAGPDGKPKVGYQQQLPVIRR